MFLFLLVLKPFITHAYFQDHITITGPSKIAVGRPNLEYSIIPDINGPFTVISIHFFVEEGINLVGQNNSEQQLHLYFDAPTHECLLNMFGEFNYDDECGTGHSLRLNRYIEVQKPFLKTERTGLDGVVYESNSTAVPIHWNIDDDDRNAGDPSNYYGKDCNQIEEMACADNDLYCINAWITNDFIDASQCNLKIKTPDSMRLWFTQNKSALCCDSNSVYETNCNIVNWFTGHANSQGNRLYVEWVVPPNTTTNEYIEFYCNDVQFAKLRYKGYAVTAGGLPNKAERAFFETNCYFLDGCEWRIAPGGGTHKHDRNSLSESIDPTWERYGEEFVATTSAPLCTNIYFLRTAMYNNFQCRCISMDSFYDQNHIFSEADATAFFTINNFWHDNFSNLNTDPLYSDIIYYNGQFAARKINDADRVNCHPSWAMVSSRFFNRPKIVHRAEQLGPIKTIQKTYIMVPSLDPEGNSLEEE